MTACEWVAERAAAKPEGDQGTVQTMRTAREPGRGPGARRAHRRATRPRRPLAPLRPWAADLLAVALLGGALLGLLLYAALLPTSRWDISMDAPPTPVRLRGFYALERNAAGPYRWTRPETSLTFPVAGPGTYHLTLALQDSPLAPPRRAVTVAVDGVVATTLTLDTTARVYTVPAHVGLRAWLAGPRTLRVDLRTDPFHAPEDPRVLGAIVTAVTLTPVGGGLTLAPGLLLPGLFLLLATYAALRGAGARVASAAGLAGLPLVAYAVLVVRARPTALALAYQPIVQSLHFLGALLFLSALPLSACAWQRQTSADAAGALPATSWRARLRALRADDLGGALWLFVTMRVVLSLFGLLVSGLLRLPEPCTWGAEPVQHRTGLAFRLLGVWQRWDTCWYQRIATSGYDFKDQGVAFFPLYPLLMRTVSFPLAGDLTLSGLVVSGAAFVVAVAGLYRLVRDDFDQQIAQRAAVYLAVFPTAFFLFAPYTEALFLALAIWALYTARRGAWGWAGVAAFLAGLTRTQGCFLALPLAWEVFRQWRGRGTSPAAPGCRSTRPHRLAVLVPFLPLCSFLLFIAYTQVTAGWTTFEAQRTWGWKSDGPRAPWTVIAASWQHVRGSGDPTESLNLALLLLCAAAFAIGLWRLPLTYSLYVAPQLLLVGVRQNTFYPPLYSTSRIVLVLFPVVVVLAILFRRGPLHYVWLLTSTLILAIFTYLFLKGGFVA